MAPKAISRTGVTKLQQGAKIAITMSTAAAAFKIWPACHATVIDGGFAIYRPRLALGER
jgi:hypothetical protein